MDNEVNLDEKMGELQDRLEALGAVLDKSVERWTWERYQRIEKKLLPQISAMVENALAREKFLEICQYLQEGDNFKKVYMELAKANNASWKYWYKPGHSQKSALGMDIPNCPLGGDMTAARDTCYRDLQMMNKQSLAFYTEVIPYLYEYLGASGMQEGSSYTLLDIGTRTGAGANLLGEMFADLWWGYRYQLHVDIIDISTDWNDYWKLLPFVRKSSNRNLFDIAEGEYDICFCSHTIEHLDDPGRFVQQARKVARKFAFFTCPFEEKNPIHGHHTITKDFVESCNPKYLRIYKSVNRWYPEMECVVFAV